MKAEVIHPLNGRVYAININYGCTSKKDKIRLSWCKQLNCFGIKSWFSERIWFINNKIEVLL